MSSPKPPLLSVLTTTRSDPRLLRCLASVDALSKHVSLEHIIQEAGSTSEESLSYIQNLKHCSYISEPDGGIYDGMNRCLMRASGIYSLVLNSDDILIEESMIALASYILNSCYDIYLFDILLSRGSRPTLFSSLPSSILGRFNIAFGMGFPHGGFVVKTEILRNYPFNASFGLEADYAQMLYILQHKAYTRRWIGIPIQNFSLDGASSHRPYFSRLNPHVAHLRILARAPIPWPIKATAISLRSFILLLMLPKHLMSLFLTRCTPPES